MTRLEEHGWKMRPREMTQEIKLRGLSEEKVSRWDRAKDEEWIRVIERPRPSCLLIRGPKVEGMPTYICMHTGSSHLNRLETWEVGRVNFPAHRGLFSLVLGTWTGLSKSFQVARWWWLVHVSRWLWNSHQRHKFLRAEAYRDIMKFRVSELAFLGFFKRYLLPRMLCCFVTILATLGTMPWKCHRHSRTLHGLNVSQI